MPVPITRTSTGSTATPAPTPAAGNGKVARVPFTRSAKRHTELGESKVATLSTSSQLLPFRVPVYGYIDTLYLIVQATTTGNAANVAFQPDAPWSVLRNLLFKDANGTPIINLSGYQLFLAAKWGGYRLFRPDLSTYAFSTTAGSGATGGSFTFILPLHVGFGRDGLGVLANMDASAQYQVDVTLATLADVYATNPTNAPTITMQIALEAYSNPAPMDQFGNALTSTPPAAGTVQFWSVSSFNWSGTGEQVIQLPRVGNLIRNHILVFRTTAGARSDSVVPATITWEWDAGILFQESTLLRRLMIARLYGMDADTGVLIYGRTSDPDDLPTAEYGDEWLPTLGTTKLALRFTPGAAGSLDVLTNDIVAVGNPFALEVS